MSSLLTLRLDENQLTTLPESIGNLNELAWLYLSNNQLATIPESILNLGSIEAIKLHHNELIISDNFCNLTNVTWSLGDGFFDSNIYNNHLCPPYPECIEDYVGEQDTSNCTQVNIVYDPDILKFELYEAYPNPFNPVTTLRYELPEDGLVNITIYDMMGRVVKTLINGSQNAGYKSSQWNATNNTGQPVSAGLYLYTIQAAGEFRQTKKMVLLK